MHLLNYMYKHKGKQDHQSSTYVCLGIQGFLMLLYLIMLPNIKQQWKEVCIRGTSLEYSICLCNYLAFKMQSQLYTGS